MCFDGDEEELRIKYPGDRLRIASLGALQESDDSFRFSHDGTHGVRVNSEI